MLSPQLAPLPLTSPSHLPLPPLIQAPTVQVVQDPVVAPLGIADPALLARVLAETTHVIHCAAR
jgi:hypothetical protein